MRYAEMTDTVEVEFETEKGVVYDYSVEKEVNANRLKLAKDTSRNIKDYEEIFQIGASIEMKWSTDDLSGTNWQVGNTHTHI